MQRINSGWTVATVALSIAIPAPAPPVYVGPQIRTVAAPQQNLCGTSRQTTDLLLAADRGGNVFFAEAESSVVNRITPDGKVSVVAGQIGSPGFSGDGGPATAAALGTIGGLAADAGGNLFIADASVPRVRKVTPSGTITTVAGNGTLGVSADGVTATSAPLCPITGLAADGSGNIFIASGPGPGIDCCLPGDYRVRKVSAAGLISTVAGTGGPPGGSPISWPKATDNGRTATEVPIWPKAMSTDNSGNLHIASGNGRVWAVSPSGIMTITAGIGNGAVSGDGGPATSAGVGSVSGLAADGAGNLFIAEAGQTYGIRKITAAGIIATIAGNGSRGLGGDGVAATSSPLSLGQHTPARLQGATIAADGRGNLFIAEVQSDAGTLTQRIRKIDPAGMIATVFTSMVPAAAGAVPAAALQQTAAVAGSFRISGEVTSTISSGNGVWPNGRSMPVANTLYLIRRDGSGLPAGTMQTQVPAGRFEIANVAAGSYELITSLPEINGWGTAGAVPGQAVQSVAFGRTSIEVRGDMTGIVVNVHAGVDVKGRVTVDGRPTSPNGLQIRFQPDAVAQMQPYTSIGNFQPPIGADGTFTMPFLPEAKYQIRVGLTGTSNYSLADILQDGKSVKDSGPAVTAAPAGIVEIVLKTGGAPTLSAIAAASTTGNAVPGNQLMSFLNSAAQPLVTLSEPPGPPAGDGGPATAAELQRAVAIAADAAGNLFVLDGVRVRKIAPDGMIRAIAGNGAQGYKGDNGPATAAGFEYPSDITVDSKGNLYIADNLGHRIRKITPAGVISTVVGNGVTGAGGDGGPAASARLQSPLRVAVDAAGNLYIADGGNARIRKVTAAGVISTIAGTGKPGFSGDGGPATSAKIDQVSGLGVDGAGNVYIADSGNARIRKVTARGVISTIAGTGKPGSSGDGSPATAADVDPFNLAVDTAGNVFIVELNRVRKIGTDGVIRTVAGNGNSGFSGDGSTAVAAQLRGPSAVTVDAKGNLYIADALNGRIRKVAPDGAIATVAGSVAPATPTVSNTPAGRGGNIQNLLNVLPVGANVSVSNLAPWTSPNVSVSNLPPATAPNGRPSLLQIRFDMLAPPPRAKDCGNVPGDSAQTVVACVQQAIREKTPFLASFQIPGGSFSSGVLGLVSPSPGSLQQVLFDPAAGTVSSPRDCVDPQLTVTGGTMVTVACK